MFDILRMNYFCVYQNFLIYGIYGYMVYIQSHTAYIRYMEIPYTVWANPNYFLCAFARGQEHRTCIHNNTHTHKHWHTHPHTHAHPHKNTHIHPHTRTHIFTHTHLDGAMERKPLSSCALRRCTSAYARNQWSFIQ